MRYRALDANGDSTIFSGNSPFLINSPEAVGQAIKTRLALFTDEWFLDTSEGTPYAEDVEGKYTKELYDLAIQDRILGTEGVSQIVTYQSSVDANRKLTIIASVQTIYGILEGFTVTI